MRVSTTCFTVLSAVLVLSACETDRALPTEPTPISGLPASYALPVSCFEVRPETASVGEAVVLDGSCAAEGSEPIIDYDWELGDGRRLRGNFLEVSYPRAGRYDVRLTVRDESGQQDLSVQRLVVR